MREGQEHGFRWWLRYVIVPLLGTGGLLALLLNLAIKQSASSVAPPTSTPAPAATTLPDLTVGTWTLRDAVDEAGTDWSGSTLSIDSQSPVEGGLQLTGSFAWRSNGAWVGRESVRGRYVASAQQVFLDGIEVIREGDSRIVPGSYSAVLAGGGRRLENGTWGNVPGQAGTPGQWTAFR